MAGNGGKIAVEKKLQKTKKRSTDNLTKVRNISDKPIARAKKTSADKSEVDSEYEVLDLSGPDDDNADAEDALCTKLNRVLVKRSTYIAKKMAQRAEEGSVTSANLILQLIRREKQSKKPSSKGAVPLLGTLECDPDVMKSGTQKAGKS